MDNYLFDKSIQAMLKDLSQLEVTAKDLVTDYWSEMKRNVSEIQQRPQLAVGSQDQIKSQLLKTTWIKYYPSVALVERSWGKKIEIRWRFGAYHAGKVATKTNKRFSHTKKVKRSKSKYQPGTHPIDTFSVEPECRWQLDIIEKYERKLKDIRDASFYIAQMLDNLTNLRTKMENNGTILFGGDSDKQELPDLSAQLENLALALDAAQSDPTNLNAEQQALLLNTAEPVLHDAGIDPRIKIFLEEEGT
ncbi:hypothetical protein LRP52_23860 [Photobacterium sp. ZSDE20]|uniref:Uncharacterized protein n=1 Tax=Photobacterium pectinilyticum TaxID=2906793 RepID=A0ABT1N2T7_9GAMM|nr:conjugative transfer protein MobI(A/C) [Photobacterium sp. ZSDE20]MCQ1058407.1 hypothetical protein [Photobacterium sp. ZSDE20]MDD1825230.1 hypothetical protein [Photobacterium sp. ZSDE20]